MSILDTASQTFERSFALFNEVGRLEDWDEGFVEEFAQIKSLIVKGASLREIIDQAYAEDDVVLADLAARSQLDPKKSWTDVDIVASVEPRVFDLRCSNGRILRVQERRTQLNCLVRIATDVTTQRRSSAAFAKLEEQWYTGGDPSLEVTDFIRVKSDGGRIYTPITEDLRELLGLPYGVDPGDRGSIGSRMLVTREEREDQVTIINRTIADLVHGIYAFRVRDRNEQLRWIRIALFAARELGGDVVITQRWRDITREKIAEDQFQLMRSAVTFATDSIQILHTAADGLSTTVYANPSFERTTGWPVDELINEPITAMQGWFEPYWRKILDLVGRGDEHAIEVQVPFRDGPMVWLEASAKVVEQRPDGAIRWVVVSRNVDERHEAQQRILDGARELQDMHSQLVAMARQAGMAEIANNVLHNVGNVLNSVNVSVGLVSGTIRDSKLQGLAKAVQLMNDHAGDLGDFLTRDEKGVRLPGYFNKLVTALQGEHEAITDELGSLIKSVDHIKNIVGTQQSYSGAASVIEAVGVGELLEDALRMNAGALARHQVLIVRDYTETPVLLLDKSRVLQILVNLIANAKQAMDRVTDRAHCLTFHLEEADGDAGRRLRIIVEDNGEGILPENMAHLFIHGFTTRKEGHGFGLHSCALAAKEMGGSLTARSDGPGQGAAFTLELPYKAAGNAAGNTR